MQVVAFYDSPGNHNVIGKLNEKELDIVDVHRNVDDVHDE